MGGGNLNRTPAAGVSRSVRSYALALCMAFAIAAVPVQAQVKNITLKASNTPVSTVMQQIEEQSGYTFFYNNDIDVTQSVSAHIASSDINSVVTAVLKGTDIAHRITDNRVVLFVGGG